MILFISSSKSSFDLKPISSFSTLPSFIKSKYGIYYVYGNHDKNNYSFNKNYNVYELNKIIENNNINILEEDKKYIRNDLVIIGRGYDYRLHIDDILSDSDIDLYKVVIDHIPQDYEINELNNIDLELSGHTHNGQIFPLGIIERLFKTSDLIYGKKTINDFTGIVTSGIAGWGLNIRTEGNSEYVIINLQKK